MVFAILIGVLIVVTLQALINSDLASKSDAVAQGVWVIVGVVVLLAMLLVVALALSVVSPGTRGGALGLPDGSISAVIALMLLFLFTLSSVYLFVQLRGEEKSTQSVGVTLEALARLPQNRIETIEPDNEQGKPVTYKVGLGPDRTTSTEFARTSIATVSTLLVAIVGFYFGQRATAAGVDKGGESVRAARDKL